MTIDVSIRPPIRNCWEPSPRLALFGADGNVPRSIATPLTPARRTATDEARGAVQCVGSVGLLRCGVGSSCLQSGGQANEAATRLLLAARRDAH
jgi:hypothetical protein